MHLGVLLALTMILFAGCSCTSATQESKIDITKMSAKEIIQLYVDAGYPINNIIDYTAETDVNSMLGRPNSYIGKTDFADTRLDQNTSTYPVGGTIEVFNNDKDAKTRYDYIKAFVSQPGPLFQYTYLYKNVFLRVDGKMTPDQAKVYEDAFKELQKGKLPIFPGGTAVNENEKVSSNPVTVTQSGFTVSPAYSTDPNSELAVGVYCEFKNTSDKDIIIKEITVTGYDKDNVSLGNDTMIFAPNFLKAGEVGYAAVPNEYGIKVTSIEELSRINISAETEKTKGTEFELSCTEPTIVKDGGYGGDKNGNMVSSIVENKTDKMIDGHIYTLVAGFLDADGKLIGGAKSFGTSSNIDPNGKSKTIVNEIVLGNDDLSEVSTINVKAWVDYNAPTLK